MALSPGQSTDPASGTNLQGIRGCDACFDRCQINTDLAKIIPKTGKAFPISLTNRSGGMRLGCYRFNN
jgi:hypothetical protein